MGERSPCGAVGQLADGTAQQGGVAMDIAVSVEHTDSTRAIKVL